MVLLKPHELNFIRQQLSHLIQTVYFVGDYRTLRLTEEAVEFKIGEVISHLSPEIRNLFQNITRFRGQGEVNTFIQSLSPYVEKFPKLSSNQVRKLFSKVKKLSMPDFEKMEDLALEYLGWRDIATHSLYLVYHEKGELYGLDCRYKPISGNKSVFCCLCNQRRIGNQIGLVTTKRNNDLVSGNYMCLDSQLCNQDITDIRKLREFMGV
ncbi:FusB/FusC family EF-G-binding protein [Thermoflavimicrobium daqui]|uniref:Elongation factor G-binding protein n=1 Tax=Thermoflavimicrobium daqui TaxID=2137476 RepID=A0A364K4Z9_9BACL|nr:FusB/FusC family EF-G-binding protein [Thermoflavimicrobium daqui]RAL24445.1 hypothetical protein DL897_08980 [Thermoflavimicrobium daqui]